MIVDRAGERFMDETLGGHIMSNTLARHGDGNQQAAAAHPHNHPQPAGNAMGGKIGRNDPCPCGSGKKYKHCHGK